MGAHAHNQTNFHESLQTATVLLYAVIELLVVSLTQMCVLLIKHSSAARYNTYRHNRQQVIVKHQTFCHAAIVWWVYIRANEQHICNDDVRVLA